ncbi:ribosome silencing factor [Povalibacter sp.]|uniref:ribosome silencing factor n=1 Tax=Povalibacter sp. TaxID=1962978 RepID=UPI002F42E30B
MKPPVRRVAAAKRVAKKFVAPKPAAKKFVARKPATKKFVAPAPAAKKVVAPVRSKPVAAPASDLLKVIGLALDDMKAVQVTVLDVRKLTDIADTLVIASGNSDRHVRSIADKVVEQAKKAGFRPMGVEGQRDGEWVLVDLQDAIVHVMLPRVRDLYRLENLWDVSAARRDAAVGE